MHYRIGDRFLIGKDVTEHVLSQCSSNTYVFINPKWGSRYAEHVEFNGHCSRIPEEIVNKMAHHHNWACLGIE